MMNADSYKLIRGQQPLLISMPHNGSVIPDDIAQTMTAIGKSSIDTDWYKDRLYDFANELGAYILMPKYSRYVIDLNRDPKGTNLYPGANSTELCPTSSFDSQPLYLQGMQPGEAEIERRISRYWQPYHLAIQETLAQIKRQFGTAVLLEAHSIRSQVPRFFDGQLPDFNFGNADGSSCAPQLLAEVEKIDFSPYSQVSNGRFKGGYITREYGKPAEHIHALQLELSQRTYMKEPSSIYDQQLAARVKPKLAALVTTLLAFAKQN
jgi:N-formylglutamate deformylase